MSLLMASKSNIAMKYIIVGLDLQKSSKNYAPFIVHRFTRNNIFFYHFISTFLLSFCVISFTLLNNFLETLVQSDSKNFCHYVHAKNENMILLC